MTGMKHDSRKQSDKYVVPILIIEQLRIEYSK